MLAIGVIIEFDITRSLPLIQYYRTEPCCYFTLDSNAPDRLRKVLLAFYALLPFKLLRLPHEILTLGFLGGAHRWS